MRNKLNTITGYYKIVKKDAEIFTEFPINDLYTIYHKSPWRFRYIDSETNLSQRGTNS